MPLTQPQITQPLEEEPEAPAGPSGKDSQPAGRHKPPVAAGPAVLTFGDGSTWEGDLVIGFDGLRSATRQALFGPQVGLSMQVKGLKDRDGTEV